MARGRPLDPWVSEPPLVQESPSGSILEARRLSGDDERWGRSASPFMMALLETRYGDWPLDLASAGPGSFPPLSPSNVTSG